VEAAGQLFHLFRGGLDYAFIQPAHAHRMERGVLFAVAIELQRILVPAPSSPKQPVYESLQGGGSWPSSTPRRCHVDSPSTEGSPNEPRFHFALTGKGDLGQITGR
jgi:hypothetical protein